MEGTEVKKPVCRLIGGDGNVFSIIGSVSAALKKDGQPERAAEFEKKAFGAGSYDEVLAMLSDYVAIADKDGVDSDDEDDEDDEELDDVGDDEFDDEDAEDDEEDED